MPSALLLCSPVLFADVLDRSQIRVGLRASTRHDALGQLVDLMDQASGVLDRDRLVADVAARERLVSTGVGEGLALPHAWTPAVSSLVLAVASFETPVDWHALDGAPVTLAVLLAGPDTNARTRVRTMAHVSRVLSTAETRERLNEAASAAEMADVLAQAERAL